MNEGEESDAQRSSGDETEQLGGEDHFLEGGHLLLSGLEGRGPATKRKRKKLPPSLLPPLSLFP